MVNYYYAKQRMPKVVHAAVRRGVSTLLFFLFLLIMLPGMTPSARAAVSAGLGALPDGKYIVPLEYSAVKDIPGYLAGTAGKKIKFTTTTLKEPMFIDRVLVEKKTVNMF
jgi:hypothetical protein